MNAQTFLDNFGHIANAPEGVWRLRELILQLAVSSDLTTRVEDDVPASILFEENQKTRDQLILEKQIKKQKPLSQIADSESPWELPESWKWCRLGEVTSYGSTDKAEFDDVDVDTWVLELEDIEKGTSFLTKKVRAKERRFRSSKNRFISGEVLYGKLRPYLDKVVLADEDGVCTTEIIPVRAYSGILPKYLRWYLKSPFFKEYANSSTHGMNLPRLGTDSARYAPLALPPWKEQKRIVTKVDELMALCDKLEALQEKRAELPQLIFATSLENLTISESPKTLHTTWLRVKEHFSALASDPRNLEELKKMILELGVQGELLQSRGARESVALGDLLAEASLNGVSKGPTKNPTATEILRISAGTSRPDFYVDETDFKHVDLQPEEVEKFKLYPNDLLACRFNGNLHYVGKFSLYRGEFGRVQVNPDKLIRFRINPHLHDPRYVCHAMNAPQTRKRIETMCATTAGNIGLSAGKLKTVTLPIPALEEQKRIVAKIDQLLELVDQLALRIIRKYATANDLAVAMVAAITGTQIKEQEKMKAPKMELVSKLKVGTSPKQKDQAPLTSLLTKNKGELSAKMLWTHSGLEIAEFYQQLKTEMTNGWIVEPEKAVMREVTAN